MQYTPNPSILLVTTVVHGAKPGQSHGGAFLIDLKSQRVRQVVDQSSQDIEWCGSEGGRGLRGIAFAENTIYLAASDRLLAYTRNFDFIESWQNPFLVNCHGICVYQRKLYLTSTGNDSVLAFDLDKQCFDWAMQIKSEQFLFKPLTFDPTDSAGPMFINKLHLSSVHCDSDGMRISGLHTDGLLHFNGEEIHMSVELPEGALNPQLFRRGVIFNDSHAGVLRYVGDDEGVEDRAMAVRFFTAADHSPNDSSATRLLKRGFARGLCVLSETVVAGGNTPACVSLYELKKNRRLMTVSLTRDVRVAIHSIAVIPPPV